MGKKTSTFIYWAPRILSILFLLFLAAMSLDVFSMELNFWQTAVALFMHNIPVLILLVILIFSWKYEIVGGVAFILAGIFYIALVSMTALKTGFEWYYVAWAAQISGVAFFIGILFLIGWSKKKRMLQSNRTHTSPPEGKNGEGEVTSP
ncbi:hypothetical protein A2454_04005 [Candidatus Peribacteria bacterium RIFOXYC2_FULL_55_14]|nr:MAG: hypothetical protein UY85_C0006G0020 [Candidatus Peribacteria bacterium GW2011_GWB1_54_5]KKW40172.1 MAG: hypothetical protein UY87_C0027G0005 [Candidatus Peribacteria bacterium GW2011_GWC2_54_8]KKW44100.1 MAG: hypothetical protein UY90_C0020G0007 [Candidatus Peregrinibacteria bacterium GW2011_GWA2_54_9]OGJ72216.1 MAG: hypothetical protein A2198_02205 [Candidatus Peribacteria bacterium RIFOXYA1_FULL_56_14]OGJ73585.1 MAG: hypothetical protein A2217_03785 [Candidatus Peribacteria bacterium